MIIVRDPDSMRFIQMWYVPSAPGLAPSVEQKAVEKTERTSRFLPLVSNEDKDALPIFSEAKLLAELLLANVLRV